jgi:hypothetical protein
MVALRVALTPPIEPHYAEQLLTTALETAHGTSLSDAMTIAACERFEDATVATVAVRDDALVDVRGASSSRRRHHQSEICRRARRPRRTGCGRSRASGQGYGSY